MIEEFEGIQPTIDPTAWVHPSAVVIGRVTLGRRVSIWPGTVLRGDMLDIDIGDESNIQDLTVAHTSHGVAPVRIGRRVVAHAAGGPLGTTVAALTIGLREELASGSDIGIGGCAQRGDGRADAGLYVSLDRVPGRHAA